MKILTIAICLSLFSAAVLARDLSSAARKERARRRALRATQGYVSSTVITDAELEAFAQHAATTAASTAQRHTSLRARDLRKEELHWRKEKSRHDRELARVDLRIRRLESRLREHLERRRGRNGLREDPAVKLIEDSLESLRDERERLDQDFRERGRKAAAFPGWLR